jgi:hypothetical protein
MTDRLINTDGWLAAGLVASAAMLGAFIASFMVPVLGTPVAQAAVPVAATAAWLYRQELRSGGWWTMAGIIVLVMGLTVVLVSPSYFGRLFS